MDDRGGSKDKKAKEKEKERKPSKDKKNSAMPLDELKKTFELFDTSKDGTLQLGELTHACQGLGVKCTENSAKKVFKMIDTDGSGAIDWHEFVEFFAKVSNPDEMRGMLAAHNQRFFDYKFRVKTDPNVMKEFSVPPTIQKSQLYRGHNSDVVATVFISAERFVSADLEGFIKTWNANERVVAPRPLSNSQAPAGVYCMDGAREQPKHMLIGMGANKDNLGLWSLADNSVVRFYEGHAKSVFSCALSSNGSLAVSGDQAGRLLLHDVETGNKSHQWHVHENVISKCAFNDTERRICTGSRDGQVKIFDVSTRDIAMVTIEDASASEHVNSVLWCSEHEVCACGDDYCVKRWDIRKPTAPPVASYLGHTSRVMSLALSPDKQWLVSGAADGSVRVWPLDGEMKEANKLKPQIATLEKEVEDMSKDFEKRQEEVWVGEGDMKELKTFQEQLDSKKLALEQMTVQFKKAESLETVMAKLDLNDHKGGVSTLAWCDKADKKAYIVSGGSDQTIQLANVDFAAHGL